MSRPKAARSKARWALQDAKNRFSEVVEAALRGEPQVVTRRGVETAVVIAHDDYARMVASRVAERPSLGAYLAASSSVEPGEPLERIKLALRDEI